ncbi:MAG: sugar transferase [bacterium]|nr:sugar transferase [bacterium]
MFKRKNFFKALLLAIGDWLLLYTSLRLVLFLRYSETQNYNLLIERHFIPFALIFAFWIIIFYSFGLYEPRLLKNSRIFIYRLLKAVAVGVVLAILVFYLLPPLKIEPRRNLLNIAVFSTVLIFLWRYIFNTLIIRTSPSRIIFLGTNKEAEELAEYLLKNPQLGQRPVAFIDNKEDDLNISGISRYKLTDDFRLAVEKTQAEVIVISPDIQENKETIKILFQMLPLGLKMVEFGSFYEALVGKVPVSVIGEFWFLENLVGVKKPFWEISKRLADLIIAFIASIPALLLFPFIAMAIKTCYGGPIFFRQKRVGKNGKVFEILKYRSTFRTEVGKQDGWEKEGDHIYTKIGLFLRRSYLDELPQIINIFKGEMSFVGPRPERPEFVEELKKEIPFYEMRLLMKPGLTGWAQIHMEDDAAAKDAPEKMQYDLYYVKNRSFILDLLIILRTFFSIIQRGGR